MYRARSWAGIPAARLQAAYECRKSYGRGHGTSTGCPFGGGIHRSRRLERRPPFALAPVAQVDIAPARAGEDEPSVEPPWERLKRFCRPRGQRDTDPRELTHHDRERGLITDEHADELLSEL